MANQLSHFGVTVLPEYIQSEGIESVLDNLERLQCTSVTTSPYVAIESADGQGAREPPGDAGLGFSRLLDRPLWSKRELWMAAAPSFVPKTPYYGDGPYRPDQATELTAQEGPLIRQFLIAAKERGLRTYLQVMAAIPPCYRVQFGNPTAEDQPLLPNGKPVPARVDRNATLASSGLRRYMRGLIRDLSEAYPEVDGLRFDWPEYPPYEFQSLLADYNPQVAPFAQTLGIKMAKLAEVVTESCPDPRIRYAVLGDADPLEVFHHLRSVSGIWDDHFRLREALVRDFISFLREEVDAASGGQKRLFLQGFPPPWDQLSGFGPAIAAGLPDDIAIKFYTMHWPMMGTNYVRHVSALYSIPESHLSDYFRSHFMGQNQAASSLGSLNYPAPDEAHGIPASAVADKVSKFPGKNTIAIAHGYGPTDDVVSRFAAAVEATGGYVELNRYAYLSDEKIAALAKYLHDRRQVGSQGSNPTEE